MTGGEGSLARCGAIGICACFGENHARIHSGKLSSNSNPSQVAPKFILPLQGPAHPLIPAALSFSGGLGCGWWWARMPFQLGAELPQEPPGGAPTRLGRLPGSWRMSRPWVVQPQPRPLGEKELGPGKAQMCVCKERVSHTLSWHEVLTVKEQAVRVESCYKKAGYRVSRPLLTRVSKM